MRILIPLSKIEEILGNIPTCEYPKYVSQLLNLANQNAQGTRPRVVGQMSNLVRESRSVSYAEWESWYIKKHPHAIDEAKRKIWDMVQQLRHAINNITEEIVETWVRDLILYKTFFGIRLQEVILQRVAQEVRGQYRLAESEDESKGIDGYIDNVAVSIKPTSYRAKQMLAESIEVVIISYKKVRDGYEITFDQTAFEKRPPAS
ncbi:MAG: MjaI family restriction endonuclease [Candidatus Hydrogenedentota bacterium]|nr:MjaI family restriction endonuclease [Candidatus Sumerlaea chitinivorans]RMH26301.1 MAG: MjaI family restriction endonuclease [Candidatus Hydrogenedentota bacterium]GIX43916.1 MAG: type II restriction endonuclease MjaI [Candidatus Sumerlaea sp.]